MLSGKVKFFNDVQELNADHPIVVILWGKFIVLRFLQFLNAP